MLFVRWIFTICFALSKRCSWLVWEVACMMLKSQYMYLLKWSIFCKCKEKPCILPKGCNCRPTTLTQSQKCNAILHHYIVYVWQTQIVDTTAHVVEDRLKTRITWRFSRTHGITPASSKFLNRLKNKSFSILHSTTCPIGARQRCISQAFRECFCFDWPRKRIVFKCTQLLYLQIGIQVWYVGEVTLRSQRFQTFSLFLNSLFCLWAFHLS